MAMTLDDVIKLITPVVKRVQTLEKENKVLIKLVMEHKEALENIEGIDECVLENTERMNLAGIAQLPVPDWRYEGDGDD